MGNEAVSSVADGVGDVQTRPVRYVPPATPVDARGRIPPRTVLAATVLCILWAACAGCGAAGTGPVAAAAARAAPALPPPDPRLAPLAFLAGSWRTRDLGPLAEESWSEPSGDGMLGHGRMIQDGRTVEFEFLRIVVLPDRVDYVAQPTGGPPTAFRLVEVGGGAARFENPAHDFPQRIAYRREGDWLHVRIEGRSATEVRTLEWTLRKVTVQADGLR